MESYWTKQYEEINYATDRGNIEDWQVYTGETPSVYTGPKAGFQNDYVFVLVAIRHWDTQTSWDHFVSLFKIDHTTLSDKGSYLLAQGYGGRARDYRLIVTPIIDFTATEEHTFCLSFWYHTMGSETDYGEFFIYMRDWSTRVGGPALKDIFSVSYIDVGDVCWAPKVGDEVCCHQHFCD